MKKCYTCQYLLKNGTCKKYGFRFTHWSLSNPKTTSCKEWTKKVELLYMFHDIVVLEEIKLTEPEKEIEE